MYPALNDNELLDWINNINGESFSNIDEMKSTFNVLATVSGLLLWRIDKDVGKFKVSENINITPTHTSGYILDVFDIWTTVDDNWFVDNIKSENTDPNIRDIIKELAE